MKNFKPITFFSWLLALVYVLSACTTAPAGQNINEAGADNVLATAGSDNGNLNSNDDTVNANDDNNNSGDDSNSNANDNADAGGEVEIVGVVEVMTNSSITINGVTYLLADFTEFKDVIAVGDQIKIHVLVNADGSLTIREIEKSDGAGDDNSNSNVNANTNQNDNASNSNDDNSNDNNANDNHNSNDNDTNSNDDDDDDNDNDDDNNNNG